MGKLIKAISENGKVLCYSLDSTDMACRMEQVHRTSATVTAALGRLITAASLMGVMLPEKGNTVTVRVKGDGPAGALIAVADAGGTVKGYVENSIVEIPLNPYGKLDVAGAVGREGFLYVVKDLGLNEPVIGQTPIVSGEIAEDITHYFVQSEQVPTVCALGVLVNTDLSVLAAGGFIAQLLPGASDEDISKLEAAVERLPSVTGMISGGMTPWDIVCRVMDGFRPKLLEESQAAYRCDCSRKRVKRALISLGRGELRQMEEAQEPIEVDCHFCNKKYRFNPQEIHALLENASR